MAKVRKKEYLEQNVYEAAKDRIRYLFKSYDNVVVSFSGGKDSTAVLNVTEEVAKELGRRFTVEFYDEEAIHPPTIDYVKRVAEKPERLYELEWYCLEWKHRNACSNTEPWWYCWEKGKEDRWVRELPKVDNLITEHPKFKKGMSFQEFSPKKYTRKEGTTVILTGVRTQESLRRFRVIAVKKNDPYLMREGHIARAHPIYDWSSEDVWLLITKFGWDYNTTYDIFNQTKLFNKYLTQRVCPPFGEEPLRGLWVYAECFPEMWHKMLNRVDGVATAWRYANTELYGFGKQEKPDDITYKEWMNTILESYDKKSSNDIKKHLNGIIKMHFNKTNDKIPERQFHPLTGVSWEFLSKLALKGDFKGRTAGQLSGNSAKSMQKLGYGDDLDQVVRRYGRTQYIKEYFKNK